MTDEPSAERIARAAKAIDPDAWKYTDPGHWWIYADGDVWPSRPVLFRLKSVSPPPIEGEG